MLLPLDCHLLLRITRRKYLEKKKKKDHNKREPHIDFAIVITNGSKD